MRQNQETLNRGLSMLVFIVRNNKLGSWHYIDVYCNRIVSSVCVNLNSVHVYHNDTKEFPESKYSESQDAGK
jgi:hypothetical protein